MTDTQDPSQPTEQGLVPESAPKLEIVNVREGPFGVHGTSDTSGYGTVRRPVVMPGPSRAPFGGWFDEVAEGIANGPGLGNAIEKVVVARGEITFYIQRDKILETVRHVRDDAALRFEYCSGVSGVHFPDETGREFHVVYHLLSMTHNRRIRLEVTCPDSDPHVASVVSVYPTADWHERETWDMFGVQFDGHPGLTRILMPDDWAGHPQRKDYPLGGIDVEFKGGFNSAPDQRRSYN